MKYIHGLKYYDNPIVETHPDIKGQPITTRKYIVEYEGEPIIVAASHYGMLCIFDTDNAPVRSELGFYPYGVEINFTEWVDVELDEAYQHPHGTYTVLVIS